MHGWQVAISFLHRRENPLNSLPCKKEIATSIYAWKFLLAVVTVMDMDMEHEHGQGT
jgi:hypothetical protein